MVRGLGIAQGSLSRPNGVALVLRSYARPEKKGKEKEMFLIMQDKHLKGAWWCWANWPNNGY